MAAISIKNTTNYATRYHTQRINRRLDDRDTVLKEALALIEERSRAQYPTIEKLTINANLTAAKLASPNGDVVVKFKGNNLPTDAAKYSVRLAGYTDSNWTIAVASGEVTFTIPTARVDELATALGSDYDDAGDQLKLQITMEAADGSKCSDSFFLTIG